MDGKIIRAMKVYNLW